MTELSAPRSEWICAIPKVALMLMISYGYLKCGVPYMGAVFMFLILACNRREVWVDPYMWLTTASLWDYYYVFGGTQFHWGAYYIRLALFMLSHLVSNHWKNHSDGFKPGPTLWSLKRFWMVLCIYMEICFAVHMYRVLPTWPTDLSGQMMYIGIVMGELFTLRYFMRRPTQLALLQVCTRNRVDSIAYLPGTDLHRFNDDVTLFPFTMEEITELKDYLCHPRTKPYFDVLQSVYMQGLCICAAMGGSFMLAHKELWSIYQTEWMWICIGWCLASTIRLLWAGHFLFPGTMFHFPTIRLKMITALLAMDLNLLMCFMLIFAKFMGAWGLLFCYAMWFAFELAWLSEI